MKIKQLALSIAMLGVAGSVSAQSEQATKVERLTITGSNIKRVSAETASPVQIITAEEIVRSGATTLTEVLKRVTANVGGIDENRTGGFTAGASGMNLRGFGSQATLILLNGRRLAAYAQPEFQTTFVDLNTLPVGAVDRIEVLKDGASAIYGSEAMAGVVNIILKDSFSGAELGASYGDTEYDDGAQVRATGSYGIGDLATDRFNVYGTLDVRQKKPQFISRRGGYLSTQDLTSWGYKDNRSIYTDVGNIYWTDKASGRFVSRPISGGCPADRLVPGSVIFGSNAKPGSTACVFDDLKDGTFNSAGNSERVSLTMRGTFQLNADTQLFGEAMYNQNKARITGDLHWVAMQVGQQTGPLPITHPQYPQELIDPVTGKTLAGGNGTVRLRAQLKAIPGQGQDNTTDFGRYLFGAKGSLGAWDWESALMTNFSKVESYRTGGLVASKFINAVMSGQWLFGDAENNRSLYPSLVTDSASGYESRLQLWDAKLTGELFALPAGMVSAAFGAEARKESLETSPDPLAVAGDLYHSAKLPAGLSNDRTVRSVFAELSIPVLKNLEASVAVRHDRYSDYGSSTTPKFGMKWTAIPELVLRGTYAEGFRAPTLVENSNQVADAFLSFRDPARCNAQFKVGCQDSSAYKSGSNPDLNPETGKSHTLGLVWEPSKEFNASLDFWKIKRVDEISTYDLTTVLANEARFANNPATRIVRAPLTDADRAAGATAGEITLIQLLLTNVAVSEARGLDLDLRGKLNFGEYGKLEPRWIIQYFDSYKSAPTPDDATIEYAGSRGLPKYQSALELAWSKDPWSIAARVNYVGTMSAKSDPTEECVFETEGYPKFCRDIGSFTTVDLSATYKGFKDWSIMMSMKNAFDRVPPLYPYSSNTNFYRPLHDATGRFVMFSAAYTFK